MATPSEWSGEFLVNTDAAQKGLQSDARIIGLANGHIIVAWQDDRPAGDATGREITIQAKVYDAEGAVVRDSFQLTPEQFGGPDLDFDLAATHDGFVIAYTDGSIFGSDRQTVVAQQFDPGGHPVSGGRTEIASESSPTDFLRNPQVAANLTPTLDNVFVAYDDIVGLNADINARVIDPSGALGPLISAAQNSADEDKLGDTAVLRTGRFVTVYQEDDNGISSLEFTIRSPGGSHITRASAIANKGYDPVVASLSDGGFVVAYTLFNKIYAKIFSDTGAWQRSLSIASFREDHHQPAVISLPDGRFVIAWDLIGENSVKAQLFNGDGNPEGDIFTVTNASATQIDIGVTGDGRILMSWSANRDVFASIWDPRAPTIDPDAFGAETANTLRSDVITTGLEGSTVLAGAKGDTILGQSGNDTIYSSGSGTFQGGDGSDLIFAGTETAPHEVEVLDGGSGDGTDTIDTTLITEDISIFLPNGVTNFDGTGATGLRIFRNFENVITGAGNDLVTGSMYDNMIRTGAGNDVIIGGAGNDSLYGGDGNDIMRGGQGTDLLEGGAGDDTAFGGNGKDTLRGDAGHDYLNGGNGDDVLDGGLGDDVLVGGFGDDILRGGAGDDNLSDRYGINRLEGGAGDDFLRAGTGHDTLYGGDDDDTILGGDAGDQLSGEFGDDILRGQEGDDTVSGGRGNDLLFGGSGDDTLLGINGNDVLDGGSGNDNLIGHQGSDILRGGSGNDKLSGQVGPDKLVGGTGDDSLDGGAGDDLLIGGLGADLLIGAEGDDKFIFRKTSDSTLTVFDTIAGIEGIGVAGGDIIKVSPIDADTTTIGFQNFTFLGDTGSSPEVWLDFGAGALWVQDAGDDTLLFASTSGGGRVDFRVMIEDGLDISASDYTADDFIL